MAILPNDISRVTTVLGNQAQNSATFTTSANQAARQLARATFSLTTASVFANGTNAVAANAAAGVYMPRAGRVIECKFLPQGNATEHASNYATGKLNKLPGNGTVGNSAATFTTQPVANGGKGNVVIATTYSATVDAAEEDFASGTWLAPNVQQVASGVAFPAGSWTFAVEWQGIDGIPV